MSLAVVDAWQIGVPLNKEMQHIINASMYIYMNQCKLNILFWHTDYCIYMIISKYTLYLYWALGLIYLWSLAGLPLEKWMLPRLKISRLC